MVVEHDPVRAELVVELAGHARPQVRHNVEPAGARPERLYRLRAELLYRRHRKRRAGARQGPGQYPAGREAVAVDVGRHGHGGAGAHAVGHGVGKVRQALLNPGGHYSSCATTDLYFQPGCILPVLL